MGIRAMSLRDLPTKKVLVDYVRRARRLNEEGVEEPKLARSKRAIRVDVPDDLAAALAKHPKARTTFESFPPGARRDYVRWIEDARRPATRARRLATTIEWLAEGKRRNWKYETC
jgi:uncharacterized protein YdeI (YjbR/CyaY-like superfamily)